MGLKTTYRMFLGAGNKAWIYSMRAVRFLIYRS